MKRKLTKLPVLRPDLLTKGQIAELAGVHRNTITRHLTEPTAPRPAKHIGPSVKWNRREIEAWIKHGPNWVSGMLEEEDDGQAPLRAAAGR